MGPMDILLLALLLLWAVLALRRMRRHGSCTCSSCGSCCCCGSCCSCAQSSCRRTTSRRSGGSRRSVSSRRSVGARREDPGDGAPLPFAKSENRTK